MATTGERIRDARKAHGMTQKDLADKVGVKFSAIHKYENGLVVNLKRDTISALAKALEVSPAWLMCIDDEAPGVQPPDDLDLTATEHELLTLYRGVNPDGQRYIMKQAQFASSQKEYCPTPAPIARSAG